MAVLQVVPVKLNVHRRREVEAPRHRYDFEVCVIAVERGDAQAVANARHGLRGEAPEVGDLVFGRCNGQHQDELHAQHVAIASTGRCCADVANLAHGVGGHQNPELLLAPACRA